MINLETLNLGGNQLTSLPNSIGDLEKLKILNLENNKILLLPDSITKLENLITLFINYNKLISIPESIGNLINLEELDLSYNQLREIPNSIGKLKKIKILNLSDNKLISIPESIDNMTDLHYINVSNNKLTTIPIMPRLVNIKNFQAQNNPFTDPQLIGKKDSELKEIIFSYNHIFNTFIGPAQSPKYPAPYQIFMSQDFVKKTQYKPLPFDNDDLRILLSENPKPHVVYACPDGHLHSAGDCGIPTQISVCGFDGCKLFVGGLHHMLVPGSYIVYHDGYKYATLWYGNFPVKSYPIYEKLVNQFNKTRIQIGKSEIVPHPKNEEEIQVARPLQEDDDILDMYLHGNVECEICAYDIILGEDNLYILPSCGHLLHKDDVEGHREGNLNNIYVYEEGGEDIADSIMAMRKCPVCQEKFAFGKSNRKFKKVSKRNTKSRKVSDRKIKSRRVSKLKPKSIKVSDRKIKSRKVSDRKIKYRRVSKLKPKSTKVSKRKSRKISKRKSRKVSKRKSRKVSKRKSRKVSKRKIKSRKVSKRKSQKVSKIKSRKVSKRKSRKVSKRKIKSRKVSKRKIKSRKVSDRKIKSRKVSKRKSRKVSKRKSYRLSKRKTIKK